MLPLTRHFFPTPTPFPKYKRDCPCSCAPHHAACHALKSSALQHLTFSWVMRAASKLLSLFLSAFSCLRSRLPKSKLAGAAGCCSVPSLLTKASDAECAGSPYIYSYENFFWGTKSHESNPSRCIKTPRPLPWSHAYWLVISSRVCSAWRKERMKALLSSQTRDHVLPTPTTPCMAMPLSLSTSAPGARRSHW